jgi:sugar transferase (PEP-CTERM/EpsH1 system associated)
MIESDSHRPQILYLTHRVPYPPNRGDRIRSYNVLRFLAERAQVDLACLADEPVSDEALSVLQRLCRRVAIVNVQPRLRWIRAIASLAAGRSATEGLFRSREYAEVVCKWSANTRYDAALALCSSMAQYLNKGSLKRASRVVDLVDVDSQKWFDYAGASSLAERLLYQLEGRRVRELERSICKQSDAVLVVSQAEADLLRGNCPDAPVQVVPNGVELHDEAFQAIARAGKPETCIFVGALDYRPNIDGVIWYCREVWPNIRQKFPAAKFQIVGRRPVPSVRQLAQQPGVEVFGDVPEVTQYLRQATIAIVPLRIARGIQNKVLEAMAAGKAVIASPAALEGLNVSVGVHVLQAESPAQWTDAIAQLFSDHHVRRRLELAGREFVAKHHRWSECLQPLEGLLGIMDDDHAPTPKALAPAGQLTAS